MWHPATSYRRPYIRERSNAEGDFFDFVTDRLGMEPNAIGMMEQPQKEKMYEKQGREH